MASVSTINASLASTYAAPAARTPRGRDADGDNDGTTAQSTTRQGDSVELSTSALASSDTTPIRQDKVNSVKQSLADGTYLHPDKLDIAIDRLLADLDKLA